MQNSVLVFCSRKFMHCLYLHDPYAQQRFQDKQGETNEVEYLKNYIDSVFNSCVSVEKGGSVLMEQSVLNCPRLG
jgi:hypothetical protein